METGPRRKLALYGGPLVLLGLLLLAANDQREAGLALATLVVVILLVVGAKWVVEFTDRP